MAMRYLKLTLLAGFVSCSAACLGANPPAATAATGGGDQIEVPSDEANLTKPGPNFPVPRAEGKDACGKPLSWENRSLIADLPGLIADIEAVDPRKRGVCAIEMHKFDESDPIGERPSRKAGAYALVFVRDRAIIRGFDKAGMRNGLIELGRELGEGRGDMERGIHRSSPLHSIRALHLVIRAKAPQDVEKTIEFAMWNRYDTVLFRVGEAVAWDTLAPYRKGKQAPKFRLWSKAELKQVTDYAKARGFDVIPELPMLTHQTNFLGPYRPDLMINKDLWDPTKPETYELASKVADEIVATMAPRVIHIGHDEVPEWWKWQRGKQVGSPTRRFTADDFLFSVKKSYSIMRAKGLEVWIWGDTLQIPSRNPKMRPQDFKGLPAIYAALSSLPKDMVICDWHYKDWSRVYTSAKDLEDHGFRVIGTVFNEKAVTDQFSEQWGAQSKRGGGMMQTTWLVFPRSNWPEVERMIKEGGDAFWGDASQ